MSEKVYLEVVAVRYDGDGEGHLYIDNGSGSDWKTRHKDSEKLVTLDNAIAYAEQFKPNKGVENVVMWQWNGWSLTSDGELKRYTGSYHGNDYYDHRGNVFTDLEVMKLLISLIAASAKDAKVNEIKQALGLK